MLLYERLVILVFKNLIIVEVIFVFVCKRLLLMVNNVENKFSICLLRYCLFLYNLGVGCFLCKKIVLFKEGVNKFLI